MVLASRSGEWYLAAFAKHLQGCNLSTTVRPAVNRDAFHLWQNSVWVWSNAPIAGITFYPQLRWHGFPVTPISWAKGATEPMLRCSIGPLTQKDIPPGIERFTDYLRAHGWAWSVRDFMGERTVHVDELEKIEGPPPEGAF